MLYCLLCFQEIRAIGRIALRRQRMPARIRAKPCQWSALAARPLLHLDLGRLLGRLLLKGGQPLVDQGPESQPDLLLGRLEVAEEVGVLLLLVLKGLDQAAEGALGLGLGPGILPASLGPGHLSLQTRLSVPPR